MWVAKPGGKKKTEVRGGSYVSNLGGRGVLTRQGIRWFVGKKTKSPITGLERVPWARVFGFIFYFFFSPFLGHTW